MNHPAEPQIWQSVSKLPSKATPILKISSKAILQGRQEVEIEHNGMLYRMRCTSLGKLILTK